MREIIPVSSRGATPFPLKRDGWESGRLIESVTICHRYTSFGVQVYGVTEEKRQIILTAFEVSHRTSFCFPLDRSENFNL
jgi:hypothetical protein